MKIILSLTFIAALLTGCATPKEKPNAEFVKSVNFTSLDTFSYKHTLISGMDFRQSEEYFLEELSDAVLSSELTSRGFEKVDSEADFYLVAKWKKAVSSYPGPFDSIDGPLDSLNRRDHPGYKFNSRMHLTVEVYHSENDALFWRADLPNIFDSIQFTEERITDSLKRAIKNFPSRVDKDPDLLNINQGGT
jgi:hypothetical protein